MASDKINGKLKGKEGVTKVRQIKNRCKAEVGQTDKVRGIAKALYSERRKAS